MTGNDPMVHGDIAIGSLRKPAIATIYIRLEEVGRADARSRIVAEKVIDSVLLKENSVFPFEIPIPADSAEMPLNVRIHADLDGDGQVSPGDFVSIESYPVQPGVTFGHVQICLHEV